MSWNHSLRIHQWSSQYSKNNIWWWRVSLCGVSSSLISQFQKKKAIKKPVYKIRNSLDSSSIFSHPWSHFTWNCIFPWSGGGAFPAIDSKLIRWWCFRGFQGSTSFRAACCFGEASAAPAEPPAQLRNCASGLEWSANPEHWFFHADWPCGSALPSNLSWPRCLALPLRHCWDHWSS